MLGGSVRGEVSVGCWVWNWGVVEVYGEEIWV